MLMVEVDLSYRTQEEILRRWRSLVARVIYLSHTEPCSEPSARTDVCEISKTSRALYGWDETIVLSASRVITRTTAPRLMFFYRDLQGEVE